MDAVSPASSFRKGAAGAPTVRAMSMGNVSDDMLNKSPKIARRSSIRTINTQKYSAALDAVKSGQQADEDTLEDLRVGLKKYLSNSPTGKNYENYILFVSVVSMFEFIYATYIDETLEVDRHEKYYLDLITIGFAVLFAFDWILSFFLADHKIKYMSSFFSVVDILTIVSIFVTYKRDIPEMTTRNTLGEVLLYACFGFLRIRILRALRVQVKFISIRDAVDRFTAEVALGATVLLLFFAAEMQYLEHTTQPEPFHTWMYYIWVTISTVGYGDITPKTVVGRFGAMCMIGFALISVPKATNELIEKMSLQSVYMRAVYSPKAKNSKHIIICGDLTSSSLKDFFGELFHEDHENVDLSAVLLLPTPPTVEFIFLMRDPQFFLQLHYLEGSALLDADLKRAKAETAVAIFIMTNKFSADPDEEDAKSILLNLSIKRYLASFNRSNMLYCMQLLRPENRRHLATDDFKGLDENDLVVCLNEIKMGAMAKAVMYPGANTLLMNLVSSFSDDAMLNDDDDGDDVMVSEDGSARSTKMSSKAWIKEYQQGCGWEIYTTSLSPLFKGAKFSELSYALYDRLGVVLFALQITDLTLGGSKLVLNPADYIIPNQEKFAIEAFVIAENKAASDLSFTEMKDGNEGSAMDRMRDNFGNFASLIKTSVESHTLDRRKSSMRDSHGKIFGLQQVPSLEQVQESDHSSKKEGKKEVKKESKWKQLKRSALLKKKVETFSYQEVLHRLENEHFHEHYYSINPTAELADCLIKTSVVDEVPYINNHLIIIGKGLRTLFDLIRPLRAKYLGSLRHIVVLCPHDIPHDVWQRISVFDAILVVRGSALEESNLKRAGVFRAAQVVVLAEGNSTGASNSSGMAALVDSDAIFTYQHVKRMNPNTQVVIEIVNQSNIAYLNDSSAPALEDQKFSPQFAAGTLFTTSLLDSIICQTYYNPQIIKVVNKLISGIDQAERSDLVAKAAAEVAKKTDDSGTSSEEDDSTTLSAAKKSSFIAKASSLGRIDGSCLYQMSLPEKLETKTYGALYQNLASQGIIPLGLLRGVFNNMNMGPKANRSPYVFTNPDKDTELYSCDRVFVLSVKPQRVTGKVDMKDWLLDIQMQQNRQKDKNGNDTTGGMQRPNATTKGMEMIERSQKKLEDRVSKLTSDVNKKLNSLMNMMEQSLNNNAQGMNFTSIQRGGGSPDDMMNSRSRRDSLLSQSSGIDLSRKDDNPTEPTTNRSRLNSKDSIISADSTGVNGHQQTRGSTPDTIEEEKVPEKKSKPTMKDASHSNSGLNSILKKAIQLGRETNAPSTNSNIISNSSENNKVSSSNNQASDVPVSTKKRHSFSEPVISSVQEIPPPPRDSPIEEDENRKSIHRDEDDELELDIIEDNGDKHCDVDDTIQTLKVTVKPVSPRLNVSSRKVASTIAPPVSNNYFLPSSQQEDSPDGERKLPILHHSNVVIPGPRLSFLSRPVSSDRTQRIRALREGHQHKQHEGQQSRPHEI